MADSLRKTFLDYDARREPKTSHFCVRCQKDLKLGAPYRTVHLVDGGALVLHPDDEAAYIPDREDRGFYAIGMDCARILGLAWTHSAQDKPINKQ